LWKSWEYTSELNSETGLDEEKPSHVQKDGFAEYHKLDYKNWTVNNYIKYKIPNFDYINIPLGDYISEEIVKIHPKDFVNSQEDEVQIYGVSKKYGLILSDINSAENFNQNYKILKNDCLVYNPARINIGSIAIYKNQLEDALISPSYILFKVNSPDLLPEYVYYFLKSKFGKMQIDDYNFGECSRFCVSI
jgi:type I restriction enzyme S subunit